MNPKTDETVPMQARSTDVELALINQRLEIVINGHDKRITSLERWREGKGRNTIAILGCVFAGIACIVALAAVIQWR